MLRLRDDQWERIREHFPEKHIPDTPPRTHSQFLHEWCWKRCSGF